MGTNVMGICVHRGFIYTRSVVARPAPDNERSHGFGIPQSSWDLTFANLVPHVFKLS